MSIDFRFLPATLLFSSSEIFKSISFNFKDIDSKQINKLLYLEHRSEDFEKPDYIHKNNLLEFNRNTSIKDLLLSSFEKFYQIFYWRGNLLYIKDEEYSNWQNIITRIPPLSLLTYKLYKDNNQINNINEIIDQLFKSSTIPSIYNPYLEELFKNSKLSEMHMHINGTTESDYVWEDALNNPKRFYDELKESFSSSQVNELYKQIDYSFSPKDLFEILQKAKTIRHFLSQIILYKDSFDQNTSKWESYLNILLVSNTPSYKKIIPTYGHPYSHKFSYKSFLGYEAHYLFDCFNFLEKKDNTFFAKLFYFYLLTKSIFHKIIVQQTDQYGFDQFEKITVNQLRELSEKKYFNRFRQLKGMYNQDFEYIEARFAPKDTFIKLKKLVDKIIDDYEDFRNKENELNLETPELALVGHFIKKPDKRKIEHIHTYRDYPLRVDLENRAKLFVDLMKSHPKYTYYIRGIDAASNELYARPEVFAPIFRFITKRINLIPTDYFIKKEIYITAARLKDSKNQSYQRLNKKDKKESEIEKINRYYSKEIELGITYHAGEDFIHLLSGIRMVYEAVEFLDMPSKSRIGHATALGISPKYWLNCIGTKLMIKKGEWLDNLIFVSFFINDNKEFRKFNNEIKDLIDNYWEEIYNEYPSSLHHLKQAYLCRKLDPRVRKFEDNKIYDLDSNEWNYKKILGFEPTEKVLKMFDKYHNPKCIKEYNKLIEISLDMN